MTIHNVTQGSEEWKQLRLGRFGSTDAQAVASNGTGLTTLIFQKVAEKLSGVFEDNYTNGDMERGKELEELARQDYELTTGNTVETIGYIEIDEFVGGSPDGLVGNDGIIEIKCQKNSVFIKTKYTKKIDPKYKWQIQHLLYITKRQWADFVVFNENFAESVIIRVDRDESAIEKIKIGLENGISQIKMILEKING